MPPDVNSPLTLSYPGAPEELAELRELLGEYEAALGFCICFQGFQQELATLPGAYAPPAGRLYLGRVAEQAACCIALRPRDARTCEMKRLFVRPSFRGRGYGRLLASTVLADARAIGYAKMVLDTHVKMAEAQALYGTLGFRDVTSSVPDALPELRYMELALGVPAGTPRPR